MRTFRSDADLSGISLPLRQELLDCLTHWSESGVPYGPSDDLIVLVEAGDTIDTVAGYLGLLLDVHDEDFVLPAEWVTDRGCALELYVCLSDNGMGYSIFVPKSDGIDPLLIELCECYVTQQPDLN